MSARSSSKKINDQRELWYYDACALELMFVIYEIQNESSRACISHLGLGEAFGNCHLDDKQNDRLRTTRPYDPKKMSAFVDLIDSLTGFIKIVGNDGIEEVLKDVKEKFPSLGLTDAIHLATAIKHRCQRFRTTDSDFKSVEQNKLNEITNVLGYSPLKIELLQFRHKKN
ncbi:MAG TPA: type II toxin-antitoxin system VapC family toxin [Candidatus Nanoarchaeia archaeon]|nr:type II toxin-antitoxin system VapC family toxin [Candidatus Nanoarchaeia archaeon]